MRFIAEHITDSLITSEVIPTNDRDLYIYGFHQGFILLFNILTMCLIGYVYGMFKESTIFLSAYMPLRSYAGGYHAKTSFRCYMISVFMMITVLLHIRSPFWNSSMILITTTLAAIVILFLAPVEDFNKPLEVKEKLIYRKKTVFILCGLIVLEILFYFIRQYSLLICITTALATSALMLVVGKIKNKMLLCRGAR